jgi:hypothetical protein
MHRSKQHAGLVVRTPWFLQLGNGVLNLICIAGIDSNISAFNGERVCNRASNAARAPEHDSISSSQTKVHSYFLC